MIPRKCLQHKHDLLLLVWLVWVLLWVLLWLLLGCMDCLVEEGVRIMC